MRYDRKIPYQDFRLGAVDSISSDPASHPIDGGASLACTKEYDCQIHALYSQRFGGEDSGVPAPLHQEGTQLPRVNGLHYGFLLSLELKRVLPIRLNAKKKNMIARSGVVVHNCAQRGTA